MNDKMRGVGELAPGMLAELKAIKPSRRKNELTTAH